MKAIKRLFKHGEHVVLTTGESATVEGPSGQGTWIVRLDAVDEGDPSDGQREVTTEQIRRADA